MMGRRPHLLLGALLGGALLVPSAARAGGPMAHSSADGAPFAWSQDKPVVWNPDRGTLGPMGNSEAVDAVASAFSAWTSVEGARLSAQAGDPLPVDVTAENVGEHLFKCDGRSPVIFDADGSLMDAVLGEGGGCALLGFAGPECVSTGRPEILEGVVVLSGQALDQAGPCPVPPYLLDATLVHELGHFLNMGHTQVNGNAVLYGEPVPGFEAAGIPTLGDVATMYPILFIGENQGGLTQDDTLWFKTLYPAEAPALGGLFGEVRAQGAGLQGVNLIARDPGDPLGRAVSVVSGHRYVEGARDDALRGYFEMPGLPAGQVVVGAEEIGTIFVGGSRIPPLDPPLDLVPGAASFLEFYGGAESASPAIDDPEVFEAVIVPSGDEGAYITLDLNEPLVCAADPECPEGSLCDEGRCVPLGVFDPGPGEGVDDPTATPTPAGETSTPIATPTPEAETATQPPAPTPAPTPTEAPSDPPGDTPAPATPSPTGGEEEIPAGCACDDTAPQSLGAGLLMFLLSLALRPAKP